jgi:hypothetical protein
MTKEMFKTNEDALVEQLTMKHIFVKRAENKELTIFKSPLTRFFEFHIYPITKKHYANLKNL